MALAVVQLLSAAVGAAAIWYNKDINAKPHLTSWHSWFGATIVFSLAVQAGYVRETNEPPPADLTTNRASTAAPGWEPHDAAGGGYGAQKFTDSLVIRLRLEPPLRWCSLMSLIGL